MRQSGSQLAVEAREIASEGQYGRAYGQTASWSRCPMVRTVARELRPTLARTTSPIAAQKCQRRKDRRGLAGATAWMHRRFPTTAWFQSRRDKSQSA